MPNHHSGSESKAWENMGLSLPTELRSCRRLRRLVLVVIPVLELMSFSGCGDDNDHAPMRDTSFSWTGSLGQAIPSRLVNGMFFVVPSRIAEVEGPRLLVDTGSPNLIVNASQHIYPGPGVLPSIMIGALAFRNAPVIGLPASSNNDELGDGLLGCTVICNFEVSFNYRDAEFVIGGRELPTDVDQAGDVFAIRLEGGQSRSRFHPASRITVPVSIEDGMSRQFLVDTGADRLYIRSDLFRAAVADGRRQIPTFVETIDGTTTATITRLRAVRIGRTTVKRTIAVAGGATDADLDALTREVGHAVDGFIGGEYLREFFVVIDYPKERLELHAYPLGGHAYDRMIRVGFFTDTRTMGLGGLRVVQVLGGTDAYAKGVRGGDYLVAVDGGSVLGLRPSELELRLSGSPGSFHSCDFGCEGCSGLIGNRMIAVEDLLPLAE